MNCRELNEHSSDIKKTITKSPPSPIRSISKATNIPSTSSMASSAGSVISNNSSISNSPSLSTSASSASNIVVKRTPNDYIFGKVIGEGSFSTVYLAKDIHNKTEVAIKVCEKAHILREKKAEYVKREREVLQILSSNVKVNAPFFVKLYCTFQDVERLYFVLTYAKHGELLPYIRKFGSFDLACTKFYSAEILQAIEHLHKLKIIHRDLKPENILLNENMHVLITDFGSAKIIRGVNETNGENRTGVRRRNSFVGTAQYVSPEILSDKTACPASDLWALGCIIYQMISGHTPFHAGSEYLIFQKINKLEYEFPDGFSSHAKDVIQKLLVTEASKRLGAEDNNGYTSIKSHKFFEGIDFDTLYSQTPPPIGPYLPGTSNHGELRGQYSIPDNLEPGLDGQLSRLLGLEIQDANTNGSPAAIPDKSNKSKNMNITDLTQVEINLKLKTQTETNKYHNLVEGNLILKQGLVDKRKGLFARRRMLLLTQGPHLYYVDPTNMVLKGEIPWSEELQVEPKNFKIFFVHTPHRTYYLEDPEGYALEWCKAIEQVRLDTYGESDTDTTSANK